MLEAHALRPLNPCFAKIVPPILGTAVPPNWSSAAGSTATPVSPLVAGHLGLPRCLIPKLNFPLSAGTQIPLAATCSAGGMAKCGQTVSRSRVLRSRPLQASRSNNPHFRALLLH